MGMGDCVQDKLVRLEDKHVHWKRLHYCSFDGARHSRLSVMSSGSCAFDFPDGPRLINRIACSNKPNFFPFLAPRLNVPFGVAPCNLSSLITSFLCPGVNVSSKCSTASKAGIYIHLPSSATCPSSSKQNLNNATSPCVAAMPTIFPAWLQSQCLVCGKCSTKVLNTGRPDMAALSCGYARCLSLGGQSGLERRMRVSSASFLLRIADMMVSSIEDCSIWRGGVVILRA